MEISNSNQIHVQNYKKPSKGAIIGGVIAGSAINNATSMLSQTFAPQLFNKMDKISNNLNQAELILINQAIKDTMTKSGLADKGVSIIKATAENNQEIKNAFSKEIDKGIFKFIPKQLKDHLSSIFSSQIESGTNACYALKDKKIILPENKLNLAFFHEAGHAMNANLSKIGKYLQKSRGLCALMIPISMIALWKTKKAPDEKPTGKIDKTTTFIKNNAGKLTFASFIPMLLEEGLATLKGNKYAKQILNPELAKKVAKTNAAGYLTYLGTAVLASVGIYLGVKVKDAIAKPKPVVNK